jgi:AhpC/TSA family
MTDEERAYNLAEFTTAAAPATNPGETMAAKVGIAAPEFEASTVDGAVIRLSDFRGKGHVVMMTGAVTSPMCAFEVPAFNQLQKEFDSVSFFLLYTRESHPAENYAAHNSFEQKLAYARDLKRLENIQFRSSSIISTAEFIALMERGPTLFLSLTKTAGLFFAATWPTTASCASS